MMAKKKKSRRIQGIRKELKGTLKDLGVIEKDVAKARANLRRFLQQAPVRSGGESLNKRKKKILRSITRRR
jgi:hypothetical protein